MWKHVMATAAALAMVGSLAACSSDTTGPASPTSALAKGSGSGGSGGAQNSDRVEIQLTPPANAIFPRADGKAKFRDRGGERQLEIEVEDIPPGTIINFFVGGAAVGTVTANGLGNAELRLNSDEGDAVPASVTGQRVEARSGGSLVVQGSF